MAGEMYAVSGETLTGIANAIRNKTRSDEFMTVNSMAALIENIEGVGGDSIDLIDPVAVYNNTRPSDWLSMPTPADNEIYLLFHIPDGVSSLLAFTVTCTGNYTIALGSVRDGAFVQMSSTIAASGRKYEAELFADEYGNLTSSGMKQVMVKVSGTNIRTWKPSAHRKKTSPSNFARWNIVEIACRLPNGETIVCGNSSENLALDKMRYFTCYGKNKVKNMDSMFYNCYSLTAIPQLDTSLVTNMSNMFYNCYALTSIPQLNTSSVTNMSYMFYNCYSLTAIPQLDTSSVKNMNSMFYSCYSLTSIPQLDTSSVKNINRLFYNCYSLTSIPQLNTSSATSMNDMFHNCYALTSIPQLDTSSVTNMNDMFYNCYSLTSIPQLNTSSVTGMTYMFYNCYSLTAIPQLDTSSVKNMDSMFYNCYALTAIPQLNTSSVTNMSYMFSSCYSLTAILLDNTVTGWEGYAISLSNCSLGHAAIVKFFDSLPTITSTKAITLTGNPGVSELTGTEKAVATGKGWTLTL